MQQFFSVTTVFFAIVACVPGFIGLATLVHFYKRKAFLPIKGTIVSSEVTEKIDIEGNPRYSIAITTQYTVNDVKYIETPGMVSWIGSNTREDYLSRQRYYHPGREVLIYYDPNDPSYYTLQQTASSAELIFAIGLMVVSFSIAAALYFVR